MYNSFAFQVTSCMVQTTNTLKKRCSLVLCQESFASTLRNLKPLFLSILIAIGQRNTTFADAKVQ